MTLVRKLASALVGVCFVCSCAAIAGIDEATLAVGADAAPTPDAAPSSEDASASDAGDGALDAAGSYCAELSPKQTFCADFDEPDAATAFNAPILYGGGAVDEMSGSDFESAPYSLLFTIPNLSSEAADQTAVQSVTFHPMSSLQMDFGVKFEAQKDNTQISFAAFEYSPTGRDCTPYKATVPCASVVLVFDTGRSEVFVQEATPVDGGSTYSSPAPVNVAFPTPLAWNRASLKLDLAAGTISATLNGTPLNIGSALASKPVAGAVMYADVGVGYISPALGGWSVRYDNVVVQAH